MKIIKIFLFICILLSVPPLAQDYSIDWYVFGSGGGQTQSTSYQLNGTIGQPIVGITTSVNYTLSSGFWFSPAGVSGYNYLPGDANMYAGLWPPLVVGSDVTYLVNYFRGIAEPCRLNGFYASADVNGDCTVVGSDVTYLVNYFRSLNELRYCPDYEPAWPPVPPLAPGDWPGCDDEVTTSGGVASSEDTH